MTKISCFILTDACSPMTLPKGHLNTEFFINNAVCQPKNPNFHIDRIASVTEDNP